MCYGIVLHVFGQLFQCVMEYDYICLDICVMGCDYIWTGRLDQIFFMLFMIVTLYCVSRLSCEPNKWFQPYHHSHSYAGRGAL